MNMRKRYISLLLVLVFAFSQMPVFAAWDGYREDEYSASTTIVDMDSYSTISASGCGASIEHTKSSRYAAWWTPETKNTVTFRENIPTDWSEYRSVQFWLYSPQPRKTQFVFLANCSASGIDDGYFSHTIVVDWQGWKLIDIPLLDFSPNRGGSLDRIATLEFNAKGWGSYIESGTEIGIDDIVLTKPDKRLVGTMEDRYDEQTRNDYIEFANNSVALYDKTATILDKGVTHRHDKENIQIRTEVVGGHTVIPFEFFDNYLGTMTTKTGDTYTVKLNNASVSFKAGADVIKVNGEETPADVTPYESEGKLFVPVKQISDALGIPNEKSDFLSIFTSEENAGAVKEKGLEEIVSYAASYYNSDKADVTECDFTAVEKKWREYYVGNEENDVTNEKIKERLEKISSDGYNLMSTMVREPAVRNLWGNKAIEITNSMTGLYGKIYQMALAYGTYGSDYYKDKEMKDAIIYALDWADANLYGEAERTGTGWRDSTEYNWWDWRIGVPRHLINTIMIMGDDLPEEKVQKYALSLDYFGQRASGVGSNRLNGCYVQVGIGIITRDAARVKSGRDGMDETIWYTDGEGMREDGSYVYHGKHPMNGAYGTEQIDIVSPMISILNDTVFETTGILGRYVADWFAKAYEPFFYNGSMMSMIFGRGTLTNDKSVSATVLKSYIRMLDIFDDEQRKAVEAFIKEQVAKNDLFYSSDLTVNELNIVSRIMNDDSIKPRSDYFMNKMFYNMDRFVQHSPKFSAGVAMSSSRIYNYESINNQNAKGWYIGDGMLYVYTKGRTSFDPNFWNTSDPYKRPGTTVDTQKRQVLQIIDAYLSDEDFVGGVSDSEHGVAAMKLDSYAKYEMDESVEDSAHGVQNPLHDCTLEAQKAWFTFDDEIVALGAGINANDGFDVLTVLDNRQAEKSESLVAGAMSAYRLMGAVASHEPQTDNPAAHAIDDSYDTRWSAEGEVYIDIDLGEVKPVGYVGISIYNGNGRKQKFDVQTSLDGGSWTTVYEGQTSGTTDALEIYPVKNENARYVRILGHEADVSTWNSFTEIKVYPQTSSIELLDVGDSDYVTTDSIKIDGTDISFEPGETKQFSGMKTLFTENMGGWYFPTSQKLSMKTTNTSRVFVESWLEHGISPTNESYSYVQLPDATSEETQGYANNPDVEILSNTDALQAVREKTLGKTGFVFWKKGTCENITVSAPLLVMTTETDDSITLSISDPTQKLTTATVDVATAGLEIAECDSKATVTTDENGAKIKLDLEGSTGRTYTVKLLKK